MIQVCSRCGTRWNVRDRRRVWCPRCHGALLAPSGPAPNSQWSAHPIASGGRTDTPRLPAGYRWIAVRPGGPPPRRRRRRMLGPTPRYAVIPRWGLVDRVEVPTQHQVAPRIGPSPTMVRTTLIATMTVLGVAALVHIARYALLIVNRTVLLNPWVAGVATWLGVAVSVIAMFMVVATAVVLTNWLIARRAAAFAHYGQDEPRSLWAQRLGCLIPLVNLVWAPVYVIELAAVEDRLNWLRRAIVAWWAVWIASTAVSMFSIATSFTQDAQGIADNTVTAIVAYLLAMAAALLAMKVVLGFERQPVEKPARRWVIVPEQKEPAAAVESKGENPAA